MFWQKKEDKGLPDLPPMQSKKFEVPKTDLDQDEEETVEKHALPAFPDSPQKKGFAQSAIKNAVDESDEPTNANKELEEQDESMPPIEELKKKTFKTLEIDESPKNDKLLPPPTRELPSFPTPPSFTRSISQISSPLPEPEKIIPKAPKPVQKSGEVFVKIDKFYSAKKALDSTKSKLSEIDELLKKIRESRMREEQELSSWEKEMGDIRTRVKEISEGIFEKIE